ncbi:asparaginase [Marinactinospora thermotolerans]|uniref:Asparaginase n=1 Tax=Marinactinospora thermotolerans DSM 45154 TaxID=1122192 RepID=A0A1T4RV71_9ACTN|nr:asparaginase [Marinactinospora thermotolerans]SKA19863.1 asparaginase [Marinactinospora thermotolerans DSM 45154]
MSEAPPAYVPLAEVIRSGLREGVHHGAVVGVDSDGTVVRARGPVDAPMFPRSSAKPFQALACLRAGAPLSGAALAIAAGSHNGQDFHVAEVERMLAEAGLAPSALRCPEDWPMGRAARDELVRSGGARSRLLMNCSGKHAAMLTACVRRGWDTDTYLDPAHPLQLLVREVIEELCGEPVAHTAVDGCGAPQLAVSLTGLARGINAMVRAPQGSAEAAVIAAMRDFPEYVAGDRRDDTVLMRRLPGLVSKIGAEGVIVMATSEGRTVAVKIADGDPLTRCRTMVALSELAAMGVDVSPVSDLLSGDVLGGGEPVGVIRPIPA